MNNPDPITARDSELLDAAIASSLLSAPAYDSEALQGRILHETTGLAQSRSAIKRTGRLPQWSLLEPQIALAASMVVCAIALLLVYLPSQTSAVDPESLVVTPDKLELLSGSEPLVVNLDVSQEPPTQLVWDEVLLLEDELAFASL